MPAYVLLHLLPDEEQVACLNSGEDKDLEHALIEATLHGRCAAALARGLYRPVAIVEAADLGDLFQRSNHIETDWTGNPGVRLVVGRQRSTSVGDIALSAATREAWSCATFGWTLVDAAETRARIVAAAEPLLRNASQPAH